MSTVSYAVTVTLLGGDKLSYATESYPSVYLAGLPLTFKKDGKTFQVPLTAIAYVEHTFTETR